MHGTGKMPTFASCQFNNRVDMCKLEDILKTEQKAFPTPNRSLRGLSYGHIEYNTDLLFMFSKKIGKPLDQALELVRSGKGKSVIDGAYRRRRVKTQREIVNELCDVTT